MSTIRTDGAPSALAVATATSSGCSIPACRASSNHAANCASGSATDILLAQGDQVLAHSVRPPIRPRALALELGGHAQENLLARGRTDQLHGQRQAVLAVVERDRDGRQAGDVDRSRCRA